MNNSNYNNFIDPIRSKYVLLFLKELSNEQKSRIIEQGIYNHTIEYSKKHNIQCKWENPHFYNIYRAKIRSIYSNIKSDSYIHNTNFKNKILNNEINCSTISKLSVYDIFPENWKDLLDEKSKKDKLKYELKPEAMTDIFKCHRCGSRSCSYYEVQTRSADEPMTQFINCLDCGNRWKQ